MRPRHWRDASRLEKFWPSAIQRVFPSFESRTTLGPSEGHACRFRPHDGECREAGNLNPTSDPRTCPPLVAQGALLRVFSNLRLAGTRQPTQQSSARAALLAPTTRPDSVGDPSPRHERARADDRGYPRQRRSRAASRARAAPRALARGAPSRESEPRGGAARGRRHLDHPRQPRMPHPRSPGPRRSIHRAHRHPAHRRRGFRQRRRRRQEVQNAALERAPSPRLSFPRLPF